MQRVCWLIEVQIGYIIIRMTFVMAPVTRQITLANTDIILIPVRDTMTMKRSIPGMKAQTGAIIVHPITARSWVATITAGYVMLPESNWPKN